MKRLQPFTNPLIPYYISTFTKSNCVFDKHPIFDCAADEQCYRLASFECSFYIILYFGLLNIYACLFFVDFALQVNRKYLIALKILKGMCL